MILIKTLNKIYFVYFDQEVLIFTAHFPAVHNGPSRDRYENFISHGNRWIILHETSVSYRFDQK